MKPIYSLALLCLMGCQSKPKPTNLENRPWNTVAGIRFLPNEGLYLDSHGQLVFTISHVTQAQWQAAQGLYNPHNSEGNMNATYIWTSPERPDGASTVFQHPDGTYVTYGELREWAKKAHGLKERSGDAK